MSMHHAHALLLVTARQDFVSPGLGATDGWELPCELLEIEPGPSTRAVSAEPSL